VCIEFELLEVKVPMTFLGTEGFSLRRDGRYASALVLDRVLEALLKV